MSALSWTLAISLGAAAGALLRHGAYLAIARRYSGSFPLATLFVNLLGSLVVGVATALAAADMLDAFEVKLLTAGGCGALTTFSTFSGDWLRLNRAGRNWLALTYVVLTLGLGVGLTALGIGLGRVLG